MVETVSTILPLFLPACDDDMSLSHSGILSLLLCSDASSMRSLFPPTEGIKNDVTLLLSRLCDDNNEDGDSSKSSITIFSFLLDDKILFLIVVGGERGLRGLIFPPKKSSSAEREGLWRWVLKSNWNSSSISTSIEVVLGT